MRTRTRTNLWDRYYGFSSDGFPTSYTSRTWGGKKYYPPYVTLATAVRDNTLIVRANSTTYGTSETITDVGGPAKREKNGAYAMNPCDHVKIKCGHLPYLAVSTRENAYLCEGGRQCPPSPSVVPAAPQLSAYQAAALFAECYNDLIPELEDGGSLINAIYELKDFKGLIKHLSHGVEAISSISQEVVRQGRPPKRPVRRRRDESREDYEIRKMQHLQDGLFWTGKTAAELDLTYSFVVRPFVNDVAAASLYWSGFRDALRRFNEQARVRNVRHGRREANATYSETRQGQNSLILGKRNVYALTAEMTYGLKPMSMLDAFMGYSGARVNARKVWNGVPFSWLIDKFCTIGEAMGSLDRSECYFKLNRLMESVKSESGAVNTFHNTYRVYSHFSGGTYGECDWFPSCPYQNRLPLSWTTKRSYVRKLLDPVEFYVRPPVLPRLIMPECAELRTAMDIVYLTFSRGSKIRDAWRQ